MKTYKIEIKTEANLFDAIKGFLLDNFREFKLEEEERKFSSDDKNEKTKSK